MARPQGLCYFPGVNQVVSATMTFGHGISPSACTLTIAPQANFLASGGTLSFLFNGTQIDFPGCKIDRGSLQRNSRGEVWRLTVLDRRWKWRWGKIAGSFNLRDGAGNLKAATIQTPQQLAIKCLTAMGETGFDVTDLPNQSRPETKWDDNPPPAKALADLCDQLGCRVVLSPLDDNVYIRRVGQGANLPVDDLVMEDSLTVDPPEMPDAIGVLCGPTRWEAWLRLEAVGIDNDQPGTILPIAQLGYTPAGGWTKSLPPWHDAVTGSTTFQDGTTVQHQDLARRSVFRMYRVKFPVTLLQTLGPPPAIPDMEHLLIEREKIYTKLDPQGNTVNQEADLIGSWFPNNEDLKNKLGTWDKKKDGPWSFDTETGIVTFTDSVYENANILATSLIIQEAKLWYRCAVSLRDPNADRKWLRHERKLNLGTNYGTPDEWLHHDEIQLTVTNGDVTNAATIDLEADYYLAARLAEYQQTFPRTIKYAGLRNDIDLDGAVQQLTFTVGRQGATITACRNTELLNRTLSYKQRRQLEKQAAGVPNWTKQANAFRGKFAGRLT